MNLSIVIPAYNEAPRIRATLEEVIAFSNRELSEWEVIVVDDGSTDETQQVVAGVKGVKYLKNTRNSGKGYTVRRGVLEARLDTVLFTDADLSTPIREALTLMKAIEEGADVAVASRLPRSGKQVTRTPLRKLRSILFRLLVKAIALRGFHDTQCGFKMFRRSAARSIFSLERLDGFGFDVEVLYLAQKLRLKVAVVPVEWHEGSKSSLRWTTPLGMIGDLFKVRWNDWRGRYRQPARSCRAGK